MIPSYFGAGGGISFLYFARQGVRIFSLCLAKSFGHRKCFITNMKITYRGIHFASKMSLGESLVSELPDDFRPTCAPHLHCYAIQRWVRILSHLCQKERNLNRTVFDLGFFWRRGRDSNPRGFWPNGFQDRLVMTASIPLRI